MSKISSSAAVLCTLHARSILKHAGLACGSWIASLMKGTDASCGTEEDLNECKEHHSEADEKLPDTVTPEQDVCALKLLKLLVVSAKGVQNVESIAKGLVKSSIDATDQLIREIRDDIILCTSRAYVDVDWDSTALGGGVATAIDVEDGWSDEDFVKHPHLPLCNMLTRVILVCSG